MVMVHGLEGSGEAGYMRSLAAAALRAGFAAHRFNMRTCGGTENLCRTLYHAGLTSDLLAVMKELADAGGAGRILAGRQRGAEAGRASWARTRRNGFAPSAPSPRRSTWRPARAHPRARQLALRAPLRQAHAANACAPPDATGRSSIEALRSVFDIDDRITAPSFGFGNAANYYATQSSGQFLAKIRVPALLVQAKDDMFVPFRVFEGLPENPRVKLVVTERGGHLGFIARGRRVSGSTTRSWNGSAL